MTEEMTVLFNMLRLELDKQTETITQAVTKNIMQNIDERIQPLIEENKTLKSEIEILNKKLNYLDNASRKNNIVLHGIKETENNHAGLVEKVSDILNTTLGVQIENIYINKIHRLGKQNPAKIRPIIISFTTFNKKIEILKNKRKLPENIYITEDFTKETLEKRKELRNQVKREKEKGNEAFIRNNEVVIKQKVNEKRKRESSGSPGTYSQQESGKPETAKIHRTDAFAYMRARSHSLSEKNTKKA